MNTSGIVTITTDFGTEDGYLGAMKGVILRINPDVCIMDITHEIGPQDISAAAFALAGACPYFPKGTVHLAVVDPGVGSKRKPLAIKTQKFLLVGPDNGIFGLLLEKENPEVLVEISNSEFMMPQVSDTFHGRDIFAPAAAYLSRGVAIQELGPQRDDYLRLSFPEPEIKGNLMKAEVVHIDRFGNLITNISREVFRKFTGGRAFRLRLCSGGSGEVFLGRQIARSYSEVPEGESLAIFGSSGFLEIALNCGNASRVLGAKRGDRVEVKR